jgi:SAM-dependent methyltransferase
VQARRGGVNPLRATQIAVNQWRRRRALGRWFHAKPLIERSCPLCGTPPQRFLVCGDRDGLGIRTSQCAACGFVFSSPYYAPDVIAEFYRESYRALFKGQPNPRGLAERQSYLRERAAFYFEFLTGLRLLPDRGAVLDVGCGEGTLLRTLHIRRPDLRLAGVEPTAAFAHQLANETGIPIIPSLDTLPAEDTFDLVVLVHVLEHVHEPLPLLRQIARHLRPDGRLYVDVPDLARHSSIMDLHLAHCNHFSRHTLDAMLSRAGLAVLEAVQHRPPTLPPSLYAVAVRGRDESSGVVPPDPEAHLHGSIIQAIQVPRTGWIGTLGARVGRLAAAAGRAR